MTAAGVRDAEEWIARVRSRHATALELSRRAGVDYRSAYRLLQEAEQHPYDVDRQVALQRALQRDDPGPRSRSEPAPARRARAGAPARPPVAPRQPHSGDDLLPMLHAGFASPAGSPLRMRAEAVRDEIHRRHYEALCQRGVADAIVAVH